MCLKIKSDQEENERDLKLFLKEKKKVFVYKIIQKAPYESFYRSLIFDFTWDFEKQKVFEIERSSKPTEFELTHNVVGKGFHVFVSLENTKEHQCYLNTVIAKFKVDKEDIIAIGNNYNCWEDNFKELVCTRLEFVKVIEDLEDY
jgi:type IV secretory pathway VirB6-like protein